MKTSPPSRSLDQTLDRANSDVVLIVDDVPDNLSLLHDALDESGYTVLVATDGESALNRAAQALPDIVLLDAMMPGMDGFEVARRLKAQAPTALDAFGYASITVRVSDGRLMWQTPLARALLLRYYGTQAPQTPEPVLLWLRRHVNGAEMLIEPPRLSLELGPRRLTFCLRQQIGDSEGGGDWLIIMQEATEESVIEAIGLSFKLAPREAEVLYWVVKGKINRDIGDILGSSPMTGKKHLERVFAKLGVETRTAAAGMAMSRIRQLHPQSERMTGQPYAR